MPEDFKEISVMDSCTTCSKEVTEGYKAVEYNLYDEWKHSLVSDWLSQELYQASCSENVVYICLRCCKLESIAKRLCKLDSECERLTSEQLANVCVADEKNKLIRTLRTENDKLQTRLDYVEYGKWPQGCVKVIRAMSSYL